MNYKNREQYKHLMRVLAVAAIVLLECAVFSVFWDRYLSLIHISEPTRQEAIS